MTHAAFELGFWFLRLVQGLWIKRRTTLFVGDNKIKALLEKGFNTFPEKTLHPLGREFS
jgi:hypothetical protein